MPEKQLPTTDSAPLTHTTQAGLRARDTLIAQIWANYGNLTQCLKLLDAYTPPAPQETAPEVETVEGGLLPCPFCGGAQVRRIVEKDEYGRISYGVQCSNGDCWIVGPEFESQQEADGGWNRRTSPPPSAAPTDNTALVEGIIARSIARMRKLDERHGVDAWEKVVADEIRAALASRPAAPRPDTDVAALPRLTMKMITAAGEAHYGKVAFHQCGGAQGVDMTANDTNYTFEQAMRRMWKGIRAALTDPANNRSGR